MSRLRGGPRATAGGTRGRILRRLILAAVILYAAAFAWTGYLLGEAETAFRAGRFEEAASRLDRASFWRVRGARVDDAIGVVALARGDHADARRHLDRARGRWSVRTAAFGEEPVLESFLRAGHFEAAEIYAAHRHAVDPTTAIAFFRGAASLALGRPTDALEPLDAAAGDPEWSARARQLLELARHRDGTGRGDVLFDRGGTPLGSFTRDGAGWSFTEPDLGALLAGPFLASLPADEARGRVDLTIDLAIDRAARRALGRQRGSFVVIDPRNGDLLAAVSVPGGAETPGDATPLRKGYEPGSIIKMITLAAALRAGVDLTSRFPMVCPGWEEIDGKAFRDWITHGKVDSMEEAVAVSCNIAFGRLGIDVGRGALDAELALWGFGAPGDAARTADGLPFRTGHLLPTDEEAPRYALARRAEGLDSLDITPIHAALLAAGLARGGSVPLPRLIARRTSLTGAVRQAGPPETVAGPLPADPAEVLRRGMVRTVIDPRGTGRRAAVEGITLALKTGTSGENPPGYDAIVIGFAPAESPRIAWGIIAEGAGKAELEGARITREFLSAVASHLP